MEVNKCILECTQSGLPYIGYSKTTGLLAFFHRDSKSLFRHRANHFQNNLQNSLFLFCLRKATQAAKSYLGINSERLQFVFQFAAHRSQETHGDLKEKWESYDKTKMSPVEEIAVEGTFGVSRTPCMRHPRWVSHLTSERSMYAAHHRGRMHRLTSQRRGGVTTDRPNGVDHEVGKREKASRRSRRVLWRRRIAALLRLTRPR